MVVKIIPNEIPIKQISFLLKNIVPMYECTECVPLLHYTSEDIGEQVSITGTDISVGLIASCAS